MENGQVLPPSGDLTTGRLAVQTFGQTVMDPGIKGTKLEAPEVESHCDTAIEVSTFRRLGEAGQVPDRGKYVVVWKREHGQRKLQRDISHSSMPAPGS